MGDRGTTYKYLGLRMFSHPWDGLRSGGNDKSDDSQGVSDDLDEIEEKLSSSSLKEALRTVGELNKTLTLRTKAHLIDLASKRKRRGVPTQLLTRGRAGFDVALINRMESTVNLKAEPTTGQGRCSVSWHADSCLEHYSSISVYHTIFTSNDKYVEDEASFLAQPQNQTNCCDNINNSWRVALRVASDSEGPNASSSRSRSSPNTEPSSSFIPIDNVQHPAIVSSLPSGSAYYLLDDFNHHHQHAVLAPDVGDSKSGVRFSSTHRLLRLGHNADYIIDRCRSTCASFHKKGPKVWRCEQLLLNDMESEWIRQFYVQGYQHKRILWSYWREPICTLLKYWGMLENRTKQTLDLLRFAAEERCKAINAITPKNNNNNFFSAGPNDSNGVPPTRAERKLQQKRKKAAIAMNDLLKRGESTTTTTLVKDKVACNSNLALTYFYEPFATHLEERATMRKLWDRRENDHVFRQMEDECENKPIPPPFEFEQQRRSNSKRNPSVELQQSKGNKPNKNDEELGCSPMLNGSHSYLQQLAHNVRQWGKAYGTQSVSDLPSVQDFDYDLNLGTANDAPQSTSVGGVVLEKKLSHDDHRSHHANDSCWIGWGIKENRFGLEMQSPWAGLLLSGAKKIETRAYNLPKELLGKKLEILESSSGETGVSTLGDVVILSDEQEHNRENDNTVKLVGWVTFKRVIQYQKKTAFDADEEEHLVERKSGYGWKEGKTKVLYGWVVGDKGTYDISSPVNPPPPLDLISRRMRSLYELQFLSSTRETVVKKEVHPKQSRKRLSKKNIKREGNKESTFEGKKKKRF